MSEPDAGVSGGRSWVVVGGKISGLTGSVVLQLNSPSSEAFDQVRVAANGGFEFADPIAIGETYEVFVAEQPSSGYCVVSNAVGVARANVDNVVVRCAAENPGLAAIETTIGRFAPAFDPNLTRYRLDVFAWVSSVELTPKLLDNRARAYLDDVEYRGKPWSLELAPGQTTAQLEVHLVDGQRRSFTLDIYRPTRVVEESYAKATYPVDGAQYAYALSLNSEPARSSETLLAVGAPGHPSKTRTINGPQTELGAPLSGAVFIYGRDDTGEWHQTAFVKASNAEAEDLFGISVALEGDLLVVGAPEEDGESGGVNGVDSNAAQGSGAAYVFRYVDQSWRQEAYLKAELPSVGDGFGRSVALDNTSGRPARIAVGAWHDSNSAVGTNPTQRDSAASNSGAAYVFEFRGGGWEQVNYLKPSNTDFADSFGEAVAIDADTLVVGAPLESGAIGKINGDQANNDAFAAGAAYVFLYNAVNDAWYQHAYLKPGNTAAGQRFGNAVDVDGATVVVGAFTERNAATGVDPAVATETADESGAAYVFVRDEQTWSQQAYLKANNTDARDRFGHALSLKGETLVVGAPIEASAAALSDADPSNNDAQGAGAVYVFARSNEAWSIEQYLKASNPEAGDNFGAAVAFDGKHLVAGAPYEDSKLGGTTQSSGPNNAAIASGAFYVFR